MQLFILEQIQQRSVHQFLYAKCTKSDNEKDHAFLHLGRRHI